MSATRDVHPALQSVRNFAASLESRDAEDGEDSFRAPGGDRAYGLAAGSREEGAQFRKQSRVEECAVPPPAPKDVFREPLVRPDGHRDLQYKAGNAMVLDEKRALTVSDFEPDVPGSNPAMRRMEAADLKRNAVYTKDLEAWAHDYFLDSCRQYLCKVSVDLGLVYLSDFLKNYAAQAPSHALATQMVLLQQHADSCLRRVLSSVGNSTSKGAWFVDLVGVLELIVEEERTPAARASAIGVAVNKLALHFAKKACGGHYPTADKLAKTGVYFRRVIAETLALADRIGCYDRYYSALRPVAPARVRPEQDDASYLFSLRTALDEHGSAEGDSDGEEAHYLDDVDNE
ncbi:52K protein [Barthadenovirus mellis]|uniref:52K protein n=1 Tax=Passerine adenovirus 1 TaxID=2779174 RepID=A0A7M4BG50_9ADEN|nr:52K protein [Passerine adenovirus 1]